MFLNHFTNKVIEAVGSKWNFHKYRPGLVGGHCIGVDPFYLMHKAKEIGHDQQVIAAERTVNDYIRYFVAKRVVQALIEKNKNPKNRKYLSWVLHSKKMCQIFELRKFQI